MLGDWPTRFRTPKRYRAEQEHFLGTEIACYLAKDFTRFYNPYLLVASRAYNHGIDSSAHRLSDHTVSAC